ncbi:MAG: transketolase [Flavobacteriales bacterium CG_4_10_14_0_2_um_filter_35_18]|nr:MAG: transketolase [Flavobacteriales bacterium CG_4_10_14_0_2_um_filter_35_18]
MALRTATLSQKELSFNQFKDEVLNDYKIAVISRECSLLGRREVLTGKAKFGIFGDGKEVPQLAMAKAFKLGDFRSGYYRDQTFMMALGELTPQQFFSGLYANPDINADPMSGGRQMGGHFATHSLDENGDFKNLTKQFNSTSDISPTAGQMPRLLGIAQASKMYRRLPNLKNEKFSNNGNEISWGTIGNASTSEGIFFETINAAGVLQVPMVISVWDDGYGISVPAKYQTTKESISEVLSGFKRDENAKGFEIFVVKGWDYTRLVDVYQRASKIAREDHVPVIIHVQDLTQPQGHSTSGSQERYKSKERMNWEKENDCIRLMRQWIIDFELEDEHGTSLRFVDSEAVLIEIEKEAKKEVNNAKREAWNALLNPINKDRDYLIQLLLKTAEKSKNRAFILKLKNDLASIADTARKDILVAAKKSIVYLRDEDFTEKTQLQQFVINYLKTEQPKFSSHLYSNSDKRATLVKEVMPIYDNHQTLVDGRIILKDNFDELFSKNNNIFIFGEDAGNIGDVNQGLVGLQEKYGKLRVSDTGIREASIIGQGIGMALRGLRPIAEIQYLDYLLYGLQLLSDDLASLHYRTVGKQKAPLIIRTRGHRLEGIWHSGSPMGAIINLLRGINILVPRNMTKAAGFYNTLLECDEPALIVENLNGYRLKEKLPTNLGLFRTPIGLVETIKEGNDVTVVSYGSTLKIIEDVIIDLTQVGIDIELIDVQTLLPFDLNKAVVKSIQKTNRLVIIDEDVPGGASAYLLHEILEVQNAYQFLDSKPITLTAQPHRAAYGTDGDYFSKPNAETIFECIYNVMNEANPKKYRKLF